MQILGAAGEIFFHKRKAQPLRDAAMDLAFDQCRIDRAADIMGGDHADDLDEAERDIDRRPRHLRGKTVGGIGIALPVESSGVVGGSKLPVPESTSPRASVTRLRSSSA